MNLKKGAAVLVMISLLSASGCSAFKLPFFGGEEEKSKSSETEISQISIAKEESSEKSEVSEASRVQESSEEISEAESEPEPFNLQAEMYPAYLEIIKKLVHEYGEGEINSGTSSMDGYINGLAVVRLVDFDGDGAEELLCAYGKENFADTQEIYSFIDGQAVSVYKGNVNYEGGVGPFVEYITRDNKKYLLTNGSYAYTTRGEWLSIEGGKTETVFSFLGSDDPDMECKINGTVATKSEYKEKMDVFYNSGNLTHIVIYNNDSNTLEDTLKTMELLGYGSDSLKNNDNYKNAMVLYSAYIESEKWRTYDNFGEMITNDRLTEQKYAIFDINNDGVFEMLFEAENPNPTMRPETRSVFCTIQNGEVKELLSCATVDGTMGGTNAVVEYSEENDAFYICETQYGSGGGVQGNSIKGYTLDGVTLVKQFSASSEFVLSNPPTENHTIDGETVSRQKHDSYIRKIKQLPIEAVDKLYNEPSDLSNRDRLIELGVISENSEQY